VRSHREHLHVRPIVRGIEFGSKLGLSLIDGYMIHETLSWENESKDLQKQAETYKLLLGYYPELIQADKIYATNENRICGLQLHQKDVLLKKQQLKYEKKRKNMLKEIILKAESEMPNNHSPSTK
jgi:hypothetical protein